MAWMQVTTPTLMEEPYRLCHKLTVPTIKQTSTHDFNQSENENLCRSVDKIIRGSIRIC